MQRWTGWIHVLFWLAVGYPATTVSAASPWESLLPFKRVEADPSKTYELRQENGPWLILAASFDGQGAERQAHDLAIELRQRFKLPTYVHRQDFDFSQPVTGLTVNRYGERARMKYNNAMRFQAVAVLVGDFENVEDPDLTKNLEKIKYARPACLDPTKRDWTAQRLGRLREFFRGVNKDPAKHTKGPMGNAFVTRNPLVPDSYFAASGVDDFVYNLNRNVKYSLLQNPGKYTVKVASFRGEETINQREIEEKSRSKVSNKLEVAAERAHRLTEALRERGTEAYEFHDRDESLVAVGSFESEGTPLPDGTVEINPGMLRVMQAYGASREPIPGRAILGLQPRSLAGISFVVQPVPMKVPRRSIAADYARGQSPSR